MEVIIGRFDAATVLSSS